VGDAFAVVAQFAADLYRAASTFVQLKPPLPSDAQLPPALVICRATGELFVDHVVFWSKLLQPELSV
jgi:hypothetical protein